jgi:hypothetical protein
MLLSEGKEYISALARPDNYKWGLQRPIALGQWPTVSDPGFDGIDGTYPQYYSHSRGKIHLLLPLGSARWAIHRGAGAGTVGPPAIPN